MQKILMSIFSICYLSLSCTNFVPISDLNFKVQTFDLFDQIPSSDYRETSSNIYYNWTLRRERLSLIDYELAKSKPNIIFFQNMMEKNLTDSDESILSSNSLAKYHFNKAEIFSSSSWNQYLSTVTGAKFVFLTSKLYKLYKDSFILSQVVSYKDDPILLINVQLKKFDQTKFFSTLDEIYKDMESKKICKHRVILGGYFGNDVPKDFSDKISDYYLKNSFSYLKKESISMFKANPLYNIVIKNPKDPLYYYDYLFTPNSSTVTNAHLVFNKVYPNKLKRSGLKELSPSLRSGLELSVRLKSCK